MSKWTVDGTHSDIGFVARHMMFAKVRGQFNEFDVNLDFDPENPAATTVEAVIKTSSVDTGVDDRDNHLRSGDFFDAEQFPDMVFKSKRVEVNGGNAGKLIGDLTIRDVTREVALDVEFLGQDNNPWGVPVAGFEASTKINREDFGLTWNAALESGGVLVGKDIQVQLNIQANPESN